MNRRLMICRVLGHRWKVIYRFVRKWDGGFAPGTICAAVDAWWVTGRRKCVRCGKREVHS